MKDALERLVEISQHIPAAYAASTRGVLGGKAGAVATLDGTGHIDLVYSPDCTLVEFMEVAEQAIRRDAELDALEEAERKLGGARR